MGEHFPKPDKVKEYFDGINKQFDEVLFQEASRSKDKLEEIQRVCNIDLLKNAHTLIEHIIYGHNEELRFFANKEGMEWAKHSIDLSYKIEWVQAIRRTIWYLVHDYEKNKMKETDKKIDFFLLERIINKQIDAFFSEFFLSYSQKKEEQIQEQRARVEELSVPIIPINAQMSVLPLIGTIDGLRASVMLEKVLFNVKGKQVQVLVLDLSSLVNVDNEVLEHLMKMIYSVKLMGGKIAITGIRPDMAKRIIESGVDFGKSVTIYATLQQALDQNKI